MVTLVPEGCGIPRTDEQKVETEGGEQVGFVYDSVESSTCLSAGILPIVLNSCVQLTFTCARFHCPPVLRACIIE